MASDAGMAAAAERLDRVAKLIDGDYSAMGHAVGKHARAEATVIAAAVTGGDAVLSHMGRKGARLSAGYDLDNRGRRVTVKLRPGGPWVLTERGAKPHTIPRTTRGRRKRKRLSINGSVRTSVQHPGAKGKDSITRTFGRIRGRAARDWHTEYVKELGKIYSG